MLTEEYRAAIIEAVNKLLDHPEVSWNLEQSVKNMTKSGDEYASYTLGQGRRFTIIIPCKYGEFYRAEKWGHDQ